MPLFAPSETDNRLLNEFFLYVLEDFHTGQSLGALKFTSDDPECVKEAVEQVYLAVPATATTAELPATRAFSRELVAYIAAFLPVATYYKAHWHDNRTGGLSDDQYTATLETLNKTSDEKFSAYLIRKIQAWFRRWATPRPDGAPAAAAAAPAAAGGGGTPGRQEAPQYDASSDEEEREDGAAPAEATSPTLTLATLQPEAGSAA